ncbi:hypothetical protein EDC04DRAFT_2617698 [Pisolithus marmoratus]|nr:hypothetical protein EDC04DRAFT_2617698 [Pisolithus marmoratus]
MALIHTGVHDCAAHTSKNCTFRGTARGYERMFAPEVQRMVHLITKHIFPGVQIQEMEMVDSAVLWLPMCRQSTKTCSRLLQCCNSLHISTHFFNSYVRAKMPGSFQQRVRLRHAEILSLSPVIATHRCGLLVPMSYYSLHGSGINTNANIMPSDQAEEREEDSDSDSDSDSDFDSDNVTTEKDSGGMSDDDMLGNPFQSMAIEISGMPELGGEHNQARSLKGEGKWFRLVQVHAPIANVPRRLPLFAPQYGQLKVLLCERENEGLTSPVGHHSVADKSS